MRVALLVTREGRVSSVSQGAAGLDPGLVLGATVQSLEAFAAVLPLLDEARRLGRAAGRVRSGTRCLDVSVLRAGDDAFVTLDEPTAPQGVGLDLVDVLLSGPPQRVLAGVCRATEAALPGTECAVLLLGDDGLLQVGAAPALPEAVLQPWLRVAPGRDAGVVGQALERQAFVAADDVTTDARFAGQRGRYYNLYTMQWAAQMEPELRAN